MGLEVRCFYRTIREMYGLDDARAFKEKIPKGRKEVSYRAVLQALEYAFRGRYCTNSKVKTNSPSGWVPAPKFTHRIPQRRP